MKQKNIEDYSCRLFKVCTGLLISKDTQFPFKVVEFRARKTKARYELPDGQRVDFKKLMKIQSTFIETVPSGFMWCEREDDVDEAIRLLQAHLIKKCEYYIEHYTRHLQAARAPLGEVIRKQDYI